MSFTIDSESKLSIMTQVLQEFEFENKGKTKPPKKEYIRVKVMRGHKRCLREMQHQEKPRKMIHGFIHFDKKVKRIWKQLKEVYETDRFFFDSLSRTDSGPLTDGKTKRKHPELATQKSHNKQYCLAYFNDERVRKSWYFYSQLLFVYLDPAQLSKKFKIKCCKPPQHHTIACEIKWLRFKYLIANDLLEDLGLQPWEPQFLQLPSFKHLKKWNEQVY